jgi:N-acetylglutamate synthase-like GNAT family acetyltransferase
VFARCERLAVSDRLADEDLLELDRMVDSHNLERSGIQDARLLSIMLRSPAGALCAGLHGYTWGGYCEVKSLWVAKERRGSGLGSLLLSSAEVEASRRGCRQVLLTTHSFQAPAFYSRHGYREVVSVSDCPAGHAYILMKKVLDA